jgi:tripartite-type tricarboxylate transporter receptor subunit TctC
VGEFVAAAKAKPGEFNFASPGSSTLNRLEMEQFMKATGIKMVHVPYKGGAGPAVTGLLGNETHVMFVTLSSAINFVKAGRLKAYAVTSQKRVEGLPQVPTMVEAGYPDFVTSSWQGVFVPAGTPRAIVAKLHDALRKTLDVPEVKQRFASGGVVAVASKTPEEFAAYVNAESSRWGKVARDSGATID